MNDAWKNDPRLSRMDPRKLQLLTEASDRLFQTPKDQLIFALTAIQKDAAKQGLRFSEEESFLLAEILSEGASEKDKNMLRLFRSLLNRNG